MSNPDQLSEVQVGLVAVTRKSRSPYRVTEVSRNFSGTPVVRLLRNNDDHLHKKHLFLTYKDFYESFEPVS